MRNDLEQHLNSECPLRPYQCEHCGLKDTYQGITGTNYRPGYTRDRHYDECPGYPLACPNLGCGVDGIKRKDMADHRSKCPQEPVECPFSEAGCKIKVCRHQLDNHLESNQQKHLLFMMEAYKQMKDKLKETEAKLTTAVQLLSQGTKEDKETINACSPYLREFGDSVAVTMPKVSEYHHSGKVWNSPPFYYKEGYKMCLAVSGIKMAFGRCTGGSASIRLLQGEHDDQLKWPTGGGPPIPLRRLNIPWQCLYFYMYGLEQLQQVKSSYNYLKGMSFVLVNDCLTFNIEYFRGNYLCVEVKM